MFNIYRTRVSVQEGDPLKITAQGLLLAANDHLWMGGGTAMRVKQAGGEGVEVDAVRQGPVPLGTCVVTGAGKLSFRRIYHAVVMGQDLKVRHEQIRPALGAAITLASREKIESLVVTPLESEEQIGPFHDATRELVATLFDKLTADIPIRELILATGRAETREAYRTAFMGFLGGATGRS